MTCVLITGFGPFPGMPVNPTMRLVRHLAGLRHPRYAGVERVTRLLPTTWAMLDAVPDLLRETKPDVVLMFGVAGRRRKVMPELRALNHQSALKPDADGAFPGQFARERHAPHVVRSRLNVQRLRVVIQAAHVRSEVSRDAGDYLCNAFSWHVIRSGVPAVFVHVPRPQGRRPRGQTKRPKPTMRDLERAAEAALAFVIKDIR
jgi:pyroglutamyl-peptidase